MGREHFANVAARPTRVILAFCDGEAAINVGRDIGIALFQSHYVDNMVRRSNIPARIA